MRRAAGEPPDGLHLGRLAQLLLELALGRDVAQEAADQHQLALGVAHRGLGLEQYHALAVGPARLELEVGHRAVLAHQVDEVLALLGKGVELARVLALDLRRAAVAEHLQTRRIDVQHAPVRSADVDRVARLLEERTLIVCSI